MLTIQFLCPLPNGLHARPAWELKEQCSQWQSEITFINHRQNAKADAKSSLALIGTGTLFNDSCSLNISGSDEEQARRVLEEYILVRFIDSDSVQPTQAELTAHPLPRSLSRLNPDLLYGNVLASGVGVGTLTLLQSDSLDSYRAIPAITPVMMPTHGPNRIPPDITAIIRTFTSEPSTGTPDQVLNRANSEKMAVTASNSFGECADLCNSSRNRRIRMRKNRQISINAARSKTASSMLNISCTGDSE